MRVWLKYGAESSKFCVTYGDIGLFLQEMNFKQLDVKFR